MLYYAFLGLIRPELYTSKILRYPLETVSPSFPFFFFSKKEERSFGANFGLPTPGRMNSASWNRVFKPRHSVMYNIGAGKLDEVGVYR